jgi:hypothetical protein
MRALGSVYTFIVGIATLTNIFQNDIWLFSYELLDDVIFKIRDFVEIAFFMYLFDIQSSRKQVVTKTYDHYRYIGIKGLVQNDIPI